MLSNIAAGPSRHIQQLITCGLLPPLVELLDKVRDGCCRSSAEVHEVCDASLVKHSACAQEPPEQSVSKLLRSLEQPGLLLAALLGVHPSLKGLGKVGQPKQNVREMAVLASL